MAEQLVSIAERYGQLESDKSATSDRAEQCAELTLPYAFVEENSTSQSNLNRGYTQGFGAQLVNHLVGKLALTILPPSQPFYRFSPTQEALDAVAQGDPNKKFEIEKILATKEEGVLRGINKSKFRSSLYPALRLAVITGNCIIEKLDEGYKVINLRDYVIKRDFKGQVIEFIIREKLDSEFLTTYKYSNAQYTRKYLGLTQARNLIHTFPYNKLLKDNKVKLARLIQNENYEKFFEFLEDLLKKNTND